ncbi:MAG: DotG/IcmE/VirB10 family protein [Alphaproteobacteria bacterium]
MTNNENDIDIDQEDDFEQDAGPKTSFKEAWDNNPLMKIGAVVLGAAVLFGAYMIFAPAEEGPQGRAVTSISGTEQVKSTPGTVDNIDVDMQERLKQQNEQQLQQSAQGGGSFIPIAIDSASSDNITIPAQPQQDMDDPLAQWRQAAQERARLELGRAPDQDAPNEKEPEIVPMPTPVRPQQAAMKMDPDAAKALAEQMRVIISSQAPQPSKVAGITKEDSAYAIMKAEREKAERASLTASSSSSMGMGMGMPGAAGVGAAGGVVAASNEPKTRIITPAGSIAYAQLLNELNSDIPGPVLAHVLSGPFAGGRALGKYSVQEEYLVLEFSVIVKDAVGYTINGIALDEKTTLAGHVTDIDRHYFRRVILPAAAKFLEGYTSAAAKAVTSTTTGPGGAVIQQEDELDTKKELMAGAEEAAGEIASAMTEQAKRPITIRLAKGTTFGILMLSTVTTDEVGMKVRAGQ